MLKIFSKQLFLICLTYTTMSAAMQSFLAEPPPITGNFSLADSQQIGPFFSFGQNIIDKNQVLVSFNPTYTYSLNQSIIEGTPSLLYGLTDSASILITLPYAFSYKNGKKNISGIGDLALDLEYAFYSKENTKHSDQATIVFSPTFPVSNLGGVSKKDNPSSRVSGFSRKNAPSSFNAISYFIGTTYSRTLINWYGFLAPGILLIEKQDSMQQGSQYYYNLGIGRIINSKEKKYIFSGLVELNGQYSNKTTLASHNVPNTGGNIIYATPSLWLSTPQTSIQVGISLPLAQHWYGNQNNISYYVGSIVTWTIH